MNKILLIFLNKLQDIDEFNKVVDEFERNGYSMYLFDDIKNDEYFSIDVLPELVNSYRSEHDSIHKIVVLSNARDLLFSWYRCYNSVVDDFVYFVDKDEKNYFDVNDKHFSFYKNLSEFISIEDEQIIGKVYSNINFNNYTGIIEYLIRNKNFSYFDNIDKFSYDSTTNKELITKEYVYKKYEYLFDFNCDDDVKETIKLTEPLNLSINIDNIFIEKAIDNYYIIPFLTTYFYKVNNDVITRFLLILFNQLKIMNKELKTKVFTQLFNYINTYCSDFKEKIYIASLLIKIHSGEECLSKFIMITLLKDEDYIEFHYEILANILFYSTHEGISLYENYYHDKRSIIDKLSKCVITREKSIIKASNKQNKRIAIVVDQFLSIRHSPTKVMLDYAKNIKRYYPEYDLKIFVEDNLYCSDKDKIMADFYSSPVSEACKNDHNTYLSDYDIEIYYSNLNKSKIDRTLDFVKEVQMFQPQVILTNSEISLTTNILYNNLCIIYMSMGGDYLSNKADVYLHLNRERVVKLNKRYKLLDEDKVYEFKYGLDFIKPTKKIERKDLNIEDDDFVMVTVGNRLDVEMDEEFIDYIMNFIIQNTNIRWLIVGGRSISYLDKQYSSYIGDKIIIIQYESDLPALYGICDVFANPRRKGGGISIAMAMNEGLPIIITKNSTDGVVYAGIDNATEDSMEDYIMDLNRLYNDDKYMDERIMISKYRIKGFGIKENIDFLMRKMGCQ